jgi:SET domain-containing protein|tara:strand:- start:59 stop:370 length:312 start_codon:yes stop_codon:yes gene_type:complete
MYKPLPDSVTIKESLIQGLGIFATERIPDNTLIGRIHVPNEKEENSYFRTPLGGFGNHSDDPNCTKLVMEDESWWIVTIRNIEKGEEITWRYTLYSVEKNNGD